MEEEIIPFQVKMGMVILGSFVGEEDEASMCGSAASRTKPSASASTTPSTRATTGRTRSRPRVPTLIDREQIKVTRIVATPHSVIQ